VFPGGVMIIFLPEVEEIIGKEIPGKNTNYRQCFCHIKVLL
jgi:hypothetical protein